MPAVTTTRRTSARRKSSSTQLNKTPATVYQVTAVPNTPLEDSQYTLACSLLHQPTTPSENSNKDPVWSYYMSHEHMDIVKDALTHGQQSFTAFMSTSMLSSDSAASNTHRLAALQCRLMLAEQNLYDQSPNVPQVNDFYHTVEDDLASMVVWRSAVDTSTRHSSTQHRHILDQQPSPLILPPTTTTNRSSVDAMDVEKDDLSETAHSESEQFTDTIPGIGSVRHLIHAIDSPPSHLLSLNPSSTATRLMALLNEVKSKTTSPGSTSKFASDDRVGQEELYEMCDKILDELRLYKEHSFPFLNKVNKRDAPDYYIGGF